MRLFLFLFVVLLPMPSAWAATHCEILLTGSIPIERIAPDGSRTTAGLLEFKTDQAVAVAGSSIKLAVKFFPTSRHPFEGMTIQFMSSQLTFPDEDGYGGPVSGIVRIRSTDGAIVELAMDALVDASVLPGEPIEVRTTIFMNGRWSGERKLFLPTLK